MGTALIDSGKINLKHKKFEFDFDPIDENCPCLTCKNYTKSYLNSIVTKETVVCHLLSIHNITYQVSNDLFLRKGMMFIYLFIYIDTNNSELKVPGPY